MNVIGILMMILLNLCFAFCGITIFLLLIISIKARSISILQSFHQFCKIFIVQNLYLLSQTCS